MAHDTVLMWFVIVAALAIVMQALVMLGIYRAISDIRHEVEGIRADVKQRLDPLIQSVSEILANSREPVRTIAANLAEMSRILRDRTSHVDSLVEELLEKTRLQVIRVDQFLAEALRKVEVTTDAMQRSVLAPIQEFAAVIKGLRSGLEFLFSRRRAPSVSEATQDEQLFI